MIFLWTSGLWMMIGQRPCLGAFDGGVADRGGVYPWRGCEGDLSGVLVMCGSCPCPILEDEIGSPVVWGVYCWPHDLALCRDPGLVYERRHDPLSLLYESVGRFCRRICGVEVAHWRL